MDVSVYSYSTGDPVLIDKIVNEFLSQGKFDKLRKECMADADTKPAYQNLQQRVESTVSQFLKKQIWKPELNKNQLRDSLRKHILESGFLDAGINRIVDQIVNPNVLATVFMPEVEEVVYSFLSIPKPVEKLQKHSDIGVKSLINEREKDQSIEHIKVTISKTERDHGKNHKNKECQNNINRIKSVENSVKRYTNSSSTDYNQENQLDNGAFKDSDEVIKTEVVQTSDFEGCHSIKEEPKLGLKEITQDDGSDSNNKAFSDKMELPSDESQGSLSKMGIEGLHISESDGIIAPDSDASLALEINEKSMSDSRDSDDSIMNKMSPISQGRLTPDDILITEEEKEKRPLTFIGRIPKLKRDDSESSKSSKKDEIPKRERLDVKSVYSSDESDSSKNSFSKSESRKEELRSGEKYDKNDRKYEDRRSKGDQHKIFNADRKSYVKDGKSRDEKSRSGKDEKEKSQSRSRDERSDRSRDEKASSNKKSFSSSRLQSRSSSHYKNIHKSSSHDREHHSDDSKSREKDRSRHDRKEKDKRDFDKRKKDDEKRKKNKNVDDHSKERNRRDDRRSTDRDSNERERDKMRDSSSGRLQSDGKKRKKEHKEEDSRKEKNNREESDKKEQMGLADESSSTEKEFCHGFVDQSKDASQREKLRKTEIKKDETKIFGKTDCVHLNCDIVVKEEEAISLKPPSIDHRFSIDFHSLRDKGILTEVQFPKIIDDFYVKFDSTGFRYFEDWETVKLDCEEEFKEYIDEAEKDLSLLSDDGSDYETVEDHMKMESLRREIISNSLNGLSNFESGLMFEPSTCDFFRWTKAKYYRRRHNGSTSSEVVEGKNVTELCRKSLPNTEVLQGTVEYNLLKAHITQQEEDEEKAEKNKENRERHRKIRRNLKLLNRYKRKIGLTFKYGKEQHKFACRRKKHLSTNRLGNDPFRSNKEVLEMNGIKAHDLREWNSIRNGRKTDVIHHVVNGGSRFKSSQAPGNPLRLKLSARSGTTLAEDPSGNTPPSDEDYYKSDDEAVEDNGEKFYRSDDVGSNHSKSSADFVKSASEVDIEAKILHYQAESMRRSKQITCVEMRLPSANDDNDEEAGVIEPGLPTSKNKFLVKEREIQMGFSRPRDNLYFKNVDVQRKVKQNFHLPLSPESDDCTANNNGLLPEKKDAMGKQKKRLADAYSSSVVPEKKFKESKRTFHQKYESQDLYKPRPFFLGSKTRGRALRVDDNLGKPHADPK